VYRSWLALGVSGLLCGAAVVSLFAGFGSPAFLPAAAACGVGAFLAYRYAADRMVREVYEGVGTAGVTGSREPGPGTTDRETASRAADGGYDEWDWADREADDPFWSADESDWEDPWEWTRTDPSEAAGESGEWSEWRGSGGRRREQGRWWREREWGREQERERERGRGSDGPARGGQLTVRERTVAAYEALGLDPADEPTPETIREAYRERAKEAHPDGEGSVEAFIRVREAYEHLREVHEQG
jgi:hypothetical protein